MNPKHLKVGTAKENRQDFMQRNPDAFKIMCKNVAAANAAITEEQRKQSGIKAAKTLWSKMKTKKERKAFRASVKDFWASMSKKERALFVKNRTLKIIEGHRRGGNLNFGKGT